MRIGYEVKQPLHHPRPHTLSRMHSSCEHYSFFGLFGVTVGDDEQIARVPSDGLTKCGSLAKLILKWVMLNGVEHIQQIAVGVWKGVSEIDHILVMREGVAESESAERFSSFVFSEAILEISDIVASSEPSFFLLAFFSLHRINQWLHPVVEQ